MLDLNANKASFFDMRYYNPLNFNYGLYTNFIKF